MWLLLLWSKQITFQMFNCSLSKGFYHKVTFIIRCPLSLQVVLLKETGYCNPICQRVQPQNCTNCLNNFFPKRQFSRCIQYRFRKTQKSKSTLTEINAYGRKASFNWVLLNLKEKEKQTLRFGSWPLKCRLLHKKWRRFVRNKAFEVEGT